jgi:hypothetical protein
MAGWSGANFVQFRYIAAAQDIEAMCTQFDGSVRALPVDMPVCLGRKQQNGWIKLHGVAR